MPNCTKCGQPLKEDAMFCGQCGTAVRRCPSCGALLKEGAAFCGQCGANVNEGAAGAGPGTAPAAPTAVPIAPQAMNGQAWVTFNLVFSNYLDFFGGLACTILVDGQVIRTVQMGETATFPVWPGQRTVELVQVFSTLKIPITRKSNLVLNVAPGSQVVVAGEYSRFFGKFTLELR